MLETNNRHQAATVWLLCNGQVQLGSLKKEDSFRSPPERLSHAIANWHSQVTTHFSMDWFKGKFTGNHRFSHSIWGFPVNFPLIQSIEFWTIPSCCCALYPLHTPTLHPSHHQEWEQCRPRSGSAHAKFRTICWLWGHALHVFAVFCNLGLSFPVWLRGSRNLYQSTNQHVNEMVEEEKENLLGAMIHSIHDHHDFRLIFGRSGIWWSLTYCISKPFPP